MRKIIILALLSALILSLCACQKQNTLIINNTSNTSNTTNSIIFDVDDTYETSSANSDSSSSSPSSSESNSQTDSKSNSTKTEVSSKNTSPKNTSPKSTSSKQQTSSKSIVSNQSTSSSEVSSATDTDSETDVTPVEVESQPTGFENEISGSWSAQRITDANGNEISGEELYGSSYRIYGGTIQFNDNGTFSLRMGVSSDDTSSQGTFTYEGENEIQLHFYDDSTSKCYIENNAGDNTITMPFVIFGDTFTVSFTMD